MVFPYCNDCKCHSYLLEYTRSNRLCLTYENGTQTTSFYANSDRDTIEISPYTPIITSIGCDGCAELRAYDCSNLYTETSYDCLFNDGVNATTDYPEYYEFDFLYYDVPEVQDEKLIQYNLDNYHICSEIKARKKMIFYDYIGLNGTILYVCHGFAIGTDTLSFSNYYSNDRRLEIVNDMEVLCNCCMKTEEYLKTSYGLHMFSNWTMTFCGFLGLIIVLLFIVLYVKAKCLWSIYGWLCFWQASVDTVTLVIIGFVEAPFSISHDLGFLPKNSTIYNDLGTWFWDYLKWFIANRWLLYILSFIKTLSKSISVLIRFLRAASRTWAIFLPISFQIYQSNSLGVKACIVVTIVLFFIYLPMLIIWWVTGLNVCQNDVIVAYSVGFIGETSICSQIYTRFQNYLEIIIAIGCMILDVSSLAKFIGFTRLNIVRIELQERDRRQEKLLLLQNFGSLTVFMFYFIPMVLRLIVPNTPMDDTCPIETFGPNIYPNISITVLNILSDTSVKRALGLMLDNSFTLILQARLAYKETYANSSSSVSRLNTSVPKRTLLEKVLKKHETKSYKIGNTKSLTLANSNM